MVVFNTRVGLVILCFLLVVAESTSELHYGRQLLSRGNCHAISLFDFYGNDIRRVDNVKSWQKCCHLCRKENGCKGYTWRADFNHCWLKHKLENYQYCENCYTQDLFIPIEPPSAPVKCYPIYQYDYFGGDIKRFDDITSWKKCCEICRNFSGCSGYTWRSDFNHCWLKHTLDNYEYCPNCYTQSFGY